MSFEEILLTFIQANNIKDFIMFLREILVNILSNPSSFSLDHFFHNYCLKYERFFINLSIYLEKYLSDSDSNSYSYLFLYLCFINLSSSVFKTLINSIHLLKKSVEMNNPFSIYCLGLCYYYGQGISQDYQQAFFLF
jgi:TPR repeat protein